MEQIKNYAISFALENSLVASPLGHFPSALGSAVIKPLLQVSAISLQKNCSSKWQSCSSKKVIEYNYSAKKKIILILNIWNVHCSTIFAKPHNTREVQHPRQDVQTCQAALKLQPCRHQRPALFTNSSSSVLSTRRLEYESYLGTKAFVRRKEARGCQRAQGHQVDCAREDTDSALWTCVNLITRAELSHPPWGSRSPIGVVKVFRSSGGLLLLLLYIC